MAYSSDSTRSEGSRRILTPHQTRRIQDIAVMVDASAETVPASNINDCSEYSKGFPVPPSAANDGGHSYLPSLIWNISGHGWLFVRE